MKLSALLLVLALAAALPLTGCDSSGVDGPSPGYPCTGACAPGHPTPTPTPTPGSSLRLDLSPRSTFLRTQLDPDAVDAAVVELSSLGLAAGGVVCFDVVGDFDLGGGLSARDSGIPLVLGVFSNGSVLAAPSQRYRVVGAVGIDGGLVTPQTGIDNLDTDFREDFNATDTCAGVPDGATHLFLGAFDAYYSDNALFSGTPYAVVVSRYQAGS